MAIPSTTVLRDNRLNDLLLMAAAKANTHPKQDSEKYCMSCSRQDLMALYQLSHWSSLANQGKYTAGLMNM